MNGEIFHKQANLFSYRSHSTRKRELLCEGNENEIVILN